MQITELGGIPVWKFELLASQHGLAHFISTRAGGVSAPPYDSLNLSVNSHDDVNAIATNRQRLFSALSVEKQDVATCTQVHGSEVLVAGRRDTSSRPTDGRPGESREGDALVTCSTGILLMLLMADC